MRMGKRKGGLKSPCDSRDSRYESEAGGMGVEVVRDDPREAGNTSFSHHLNPHLGV